MGCHFLSRPHPTNWGEHNPEVNKVKGELCRRLYGYDCAMCHGKNGDGKGELAKDIKVEIGDFSDPAVLKERTDGELFYIMKNGKGEMPPENRGKDEALWDLVNYIRSLATKKPSPEEKGTALQVSQRP